jgi:hypothetical protein
MIQSYLIRDISVICVEVLNSFHRFPALQGVQQFHQSQVELRFAGRNKGIAHQAIGLKQRWALAYFIAPELRVLLRVHGKWANEQTAQADMSIPAARCIAIIRENRPAPCASRYASRVYGKAL